jgi:predicted pyridoxine 5'-phosphate oxidase superfamily flavin-nucleotide-binding protein
MAQQYDQISDRLAEFIAAQHVFFVATAAGEGRVNISPKGLEALRILGPNRAVWLNGTGLESYHREKNLTSIDGFPTGLRVPGAC